MPINLDELTLEAVAELICGDDEQLVYRKGWELPLFLRRAGVSCPDFNNSTRKWWVLEQLIGYNEHPDQIERVLLRLIEPREYLKARDKHPVVVERLNKVLAIEGLRLSIDADGVTPRVNHISPSFSAGPSTVATPDSEQANRNVFGMCP